MEFIPNGDDGISLDVPYFGEARSADGWQGQSTSRSYDTLKSDVTKALARIGGVVHSIRRGTYNIGGFIRAGAQIHYSIEGVGSNMHYGRLDIAALPVHKSTRGDWQKIQRKRQERSLCMALYNVIQALQAQWVLKQLNPAYVPLMPWLLADENRTISQIYLESGITPALPPPSEEGETIVGEFTEVDDGGKDG